MNFYYTPDGTAVLGPHSLDDLISHYRSGQIPGGTRVCAEGQEEWLTIDSFVQPSPPALPSSSPNSQLQVVHARVENAVEVASDKLQRFLGEEQDAGTISKVHARALELCTQGEEIRYIAVQKKPIITIAPDAVLLTNKRLIIFRPRILGMTFDDLPWREVRDVHVKEGMLGATFSVLSTTGKRFEIDSLPKAQARKLYQFGQEMEEQQHHQRRHRDLEEKRATAGGITFGGAPAAEDTTQKLLQLKALADQGLISAGEYEAKKADIMSRF